MNIIKKEKKSHTSDTNCVIINTLNCKLSHKINSNVKKRETHQRQPELINRKKGHECH